MASFFIHLGTMGIFLMGLCDGVLFVPFGHDVLMIVMSARHPHMVWPYVIVGSIGSTIGYAIVDVIARKGGEQGLRQKVGEARFDRLKKKLEKRAGVAVAVGSMIPPPFPFTVLFSAASVFQYPRTKLYSILFAMRVVRYALIGLLARHYGRHLIRIFDSRGFKAFVIGLIVVSVAGSAWTVYKWLRGTRGRGGNPKSELAPAA